MTDLIRWRRVAVAAALLFVFTWLVLAAPDHLRTLRERRAMDSPPQPATNAQQADLLRLLHARFALPSQYSPYEDGMPLQQPLLLDRSPSLCQADASTTCEGKWVVAQLLDPRQLVGTPLDLRRALVETNATAARQPDPKLPGLAMEPAESLQWLFNGDRGKGWERLRLLRPHMTVIVRPTRAVVSADGSLALLLLLGDCETNCPAAMLYLFEHKKEGWVLLDRKPLRPGGDGPPPVSPH